MRGFSGSSQTRITRNQRNSDLDRMPVTYTAVVTRMKVGRKIPKKIVEAITFHHLALSDQLFIHNAQEIALRTMVLWMTKIAKFSAPKFQN